MAARKPSTKKHTPCAVPVDLRDELNLVVAVLQTVFAALEHEEDFQPLAVTLFECVVLPLTRIRDALERGS